MLTAGDRQNRQSSRTSILPYLRELEAGKKKPSPTPSRKSTKVLESDNNSGTSPHKEETYVDAVRSIMAEG